MENEAQLQTITLYIARSVTAAHCYQTRVTAVAGAHNINVNESTQQKMRKVLKRPGSKKSTKEPVQTSFQHFKVSLHSLTIQVTTIEICKMTLQFSVIMHLALVVP